MTQYMYFLILVSARGLVEVGAKSTETGLDEYPVTENKPTIPNVPMSCPKGKESYFNVQKNRAVCRLCTAGYYSSHRNARCKRCSKCRQYGKSLSGVFLACTRKQNTICNYPWIVDKYLRKYGLHRKRHGRVEHRSGNFRDLKPSSGRTCRGNTCKRNGGKRKTKRPKYLVSTPVNTAVTYKKRFKVIEEDSSKVDSKGVAPNLQEEEPEEQKDRHHVSIISGATSAGVTLVLILSIVIFIRLRRRKTKSFKMTNIDTGLKNLRSVRADNSDHSQESLPHLLSEDQNTVLNEASPYLSLNTVDVRSSCKDVVHAKSSEESPERPTSGMSCDSDIAVFTSSTIVSRHSSGSSIRSHILIPLSEKFNAPSPFLIHSTEDSSFQIHQSNNIEISPSQHTRNPNVNLIRNIGVGCANSDSGVHSFEEFLGQNDNPLEKHSPCTKENLFKNHFSDIQTQTPVAVSPPRNIFNEDWSFFGTYYHSGGFLQKHKSGIELIVQKGTLAKDDSVEIYGSVYTDIARMRDVFQLKSDHWLVSAAVEYHTEPTDRRFKKQFIVSIPHCLQGSFRRAFFKVHWFCRGKDREVEVKDVPLKSESNISEAAWYEFVSGNRVLVHTDHFSGFYCTYCGKDNIPVALCAMVYGSHEQIFPEMREVRVRALLWDSKCFLNDYKEEYSSNEETPGRRLLDKQTINLQDQVGRNSVLCCKLQPCGSEVKKWRHKTRPGCNTPMFKGVQTRRVDHIVKCCRESGPQVVEWVLETFPGELPLNLFQCIIDINHMQEKSNSEQAIGCQEDGQTTVYISDLKLSSPYPNINREEELNVQKEIMDVLVNSLNREQTRDLARIMNVRMIGRDEEWFREGESAFINHVIEDCFKENRDYFLTNLPHILHELKAEKVKRLLQDKHLPLALAFCELQSPLSFPTGKPVQETGWADNTRRKEYAESADTSVDGIRMDDLKETDNNDYFYRESYV